MTLRSSALALAMLFLVPFETAHGRELPARKAGARPVASSFLFTFNSDMEVCLHHFLYRWARMEAMAAGEIPRRYPEPTMRDSDLRILQDLNPEDRTIWDRARAHYRKHVVSRSLLFDDGLIALRDTLAASREVVTLAESERQTLAHLKDARDVYSRIWWPRHDVENREWVAAVIGDVVRFERQISQRMEAVYAVEWPSPPNRVDLVPYASSTVAYTTNEPHTMIAADDPESRQPWALELLFHEASHADALEGRLHRLIEAAYKGRDQEPPRNLWHVLLFSIAGKATQDVLAEAGRSEYVPLAQQFEIFHRRDVDLKTWEILRRVWFPAMEKGSVLESVMPAIVEGFE